MPEFKFIPLVQLVEPEMPVREGMDEHKLNDLAESIREVGILQPLIVVPSSVGNGLAAGAPQGDVTPSPTPAATLFEIVAGHRRYKAAVIVGLEHVPCLLFADKEIAQHAAKLHENIYREDLTPAEEAAFYAELIEKYDYTEDQLLAAVHQEKSYVYSRLDLWLGNKDVFEALRKREIGVSVAQQLNRVKDETHCRYLLKLAVEGGATVATVAKWVADHRLQVGAQAPTPEGAAPVETSQPLANGGRRCFFCGRDSDQFNLVAVWIHDWEKTTIEKQIANAGSASTAVLGAAAPGAENG